MNPGQSNLVWADSFIAALVAQGLRHVVLAPGARSAPLALAVLRRPEIDCHVINDERAAGFFALGIGKAGGLPAAVLVTSGTAAANLLPAVMEAHLAQVPLLVLTADRPPEAVGWGGNQTVDQIGLYGRHVRAFHAVPPPAAEIDANYLRALAARLVATTRWPLPGPVHVNLPFREPLLPETIVPPPELPTPIETHPPMTMLPAGLDPLAARLSGQPGVILCGESPAAAGFAQTMVRLAESLDAPLLADPLSGLRHGPHDKQRVLTRQSRFLKRTTPPAPAWVLRFGRFPVSRAIERWLAGLTDCEHILVTSPGDWPDPLWCSDTVLCGDAQAIAAALASHCRPASADFCAQWQAADGVQAVSENPCFFEGAVARILIDMLPAEAQCFIGNSLAIRAVDAFCGCSDKPLTLHGNRGASGIDGNLATAAGIAAASGKFTAALLGDQALLHDCNSLALLSERKGLLVVMDNGGGGIFDHLPFAHTLPPALLQRGWTAPSRCDFSALATGFGLKHARVTDGNQLQEVLSQAIATEAGWLVQAVIDRQTSRDEFVG